MNPEELQLLRKRVDAGLKTAVAKALEEHRRAGRLVPIWRDGRIVEVLPPSTVEFESLTLREEPPKREL